jgi:hypothetical protein
MEHHVESFDPLTVCEVTERYFENISDRKVEYGKDKGKGVPVLP